MVWAVTFGACAHGSRVTVPRPLPCTRGTHGGLASHALAWGHRGFGALTTDRGTVVLREYTPDGDARDGVREVTDAVGPEPRLALGRTRNAWLAVVAPRAAEAVIARVEDAGGVTVQALGDRVTGDVGVVVHNGTAAVFYASAEGTRMVRVEDSPGAVHVCPADLEASAVVPTPDGYVGLVPVIDHATGDGTGLDVVALDTQCEVDSTTHLWSGALNGRVHALATDHHGRVYVAFGDRDGAVWLAIVSDGASVRVRPWSFLSRGVSPRLVANARGALVIAVRSDEASDTLTASRVDTDGILQRSQTVTTAPRMEILVVAPDPWGGALVGWLQPDPTGGAARTGTGIYSMVTRVCPSAR